MTDDSSDKCLRLLHREIERLEKLNDTKLAALRTEIIVTLSSQAAALQLQAKEYERRLQDLNHSHQQAVERYSTFLPREIYETSQKDFRGWQNTIDTERAAGKGQKTAYLSVVSMALSLITLVLVGYGILR